MSRSDDRDTTLRVFDEMKLPIVDERGLNPLTHAPMTLTHTRPGLQPGDVIMMLDKVPVKRTETLSSVAQRLLRRSVARGTWVTIARPIGRSPLAHSGSGQPAVVQLSPSPIAQTSGAPITDYDHGFSFATASSPVAQYSGGASDDLGGELSDGESSVAPPPPPTYRGGQRLTGASSPTHVDDESPVFSDSDTEAFDAPSASYNAVDRSSPSANRQTRSPTSPRLPDMQWPGVKPYVTETRVDSDSD